MQRRSGFRRALLALLPLVAAACRDSSPTLTGDEFFPGGGRPVTLQAIVAGAGVFTQRGTFSGYPPGVDFPTKILVADKYGGVLDAHGLLRVTGFPARIDYTQGSAVRQDSVFTYGAGTLVAQLDSAGSVAVPTTLRLRTLAQGFDRTTATWTVASDTGGVRTAWAVPGGTPAANLSQALWTPSQAGDSLVFALDSLQVAQLADSTFKGLLLSTDEPGTRVQVRSFTLRTRVHPKTASPDTAIAQTLTGNTATYVFTPEPPHSAGQLEVGGVRSARTLFDLNLDQRVPACASAAPSCGTLRLSEVSLNEVAVLLRPVAVSPAFASPDSIPLTLRVVQEPDLGFRAPLAGLVNSALVAYHPGDTLVAIPFNEYAKTLVAKDSLTSSLALLSEPAANTFGMVWFEPTPRLRITYTLPAKPRLP
ncbi:MAG: hypothetical protein JWM27_5052 [Gemmatimonadetes bacterium]|nr:hypothetical protein [Gemmatimonadota bacterium]